MAALRRYCILDTPAEAAFDDITRLVAAVCEAPVALISLVDAERQWFKSEIGLGVSETPLEASICAHAILQPGLLVVPDTLEDERFAGNPLVAGEPHLRFYAGALLASADGLPLGTLCVLDYQPRELTADQKDVLMMLARMVIAQLDLRLSLAAQSKLLAEKEQLLADKEVLLKELNHRVKNSLQMVSSMLGLQTRQIADPDARRHFADAARRVGAIALVHDRLYQADVTGRVEVGQYLRELCAELERSLAGRGKPAITVAAVRAELEIERAVPLALIVNELVTNALKYAYPDERAEAPVSVTLVVAGPGALRLEVTDYGRGLPPDFDPGRSAGLGMRLVVALAEQLGGRLSFARRAPGAQFAIELPADAGR